MAEIDNMMVQAKYERHINACLVLEVNVFAYSYVLTFIKSICDVSHKNSLGDS